METIRTSYAAAGFWHRVGAALAALARRTGCSLAQSPLPEIREAGRDLRDSGDWARPAAGRRPR